MTSKNALIGWIEAVAAAILLLGVETASAQRPSLVEQEARLDETQAALCAKADADADTYRPYFCPPRCDCLANLTLADSCISPSPGEILVQTAPDVIPARDAFCTGVCINISLITSGDYCQTSADCPANFSCNFRELGDAVLCTDNVPPCSNCAAGYSCAPLVPPFTQTFCSAAPGAACPDTAPGSPIVCASLSELAISPAVLMTLTGVAAANSPDVVTCQGVQINSNDALECIAQIESATGLDCP